MTILIDWKPERVIYAKDKDHYKVTASISIIHLGHPVIRRPPIRSVCSSKAQNRGNSKLLGRIAVIVFNVPSPYVYHFPKFSKIRGTMSLVGDVWFLHVIKLFTRKYNRIVSAGSCVFHKCFRNIYQVKCLGIIVCSCKTIVLFDIKVKREEIGLFRLGSETSTKRNSCNLSTK